VEECGASTGTFPYRQVDGQLESVQLGGAEGYSTMIDLILFTTIGVGLLTGFFDAQFSGPPRKVPESVMTAVGEMVPLEGLAFTNAAGLLDDAEYRLLCSNIYLQETYMVINAKEISEPGAARRARRRLWHAAPPTSRQKPRPFPNRRVYRSLCQSDRICYCRTGC
jgi:hypothetical protein